MLDTFSAIVGSVRITLSHEGIDEIFDGRNAISTDCYTYLIDCLLNTGGTMNPITDIGLYWTAGTIAGSTITPIYGSKPTVKSVRFQATIANVVAPIKNIYEARLLNNSDTVYSTYGLPVLSIPAGYTMSVDWTIAYP